MFLLVPRGHHFSHGFSHHPPGLRKLVILLQAVLFKYLFPWRGKGLCKGEGIRRGKGLCEQHLNLYKK